MGNTVEKIASRLKSSESKWLVDRKIKLGELFDISFNEHNIFLYWSDTWKNHDSIFPVFLIEEAVSFVNTFSPVAVKSSDADVYTYDGEHRRGLYLSITVKK